MGPSKYRPRPEFEDALDTWLKDPANAETLRNTATDVRVVLEILIETAGVPKPEKNEEWIELMSAVAVYGRAFEDDEPV